MIKIQCRARINAEIVHFYANKRQKMHHQNFNMSQDARCWLEELTPLTLNLNIDFVVWVTYKNFSNKANSHRCCHIRLTTQRGLETIYTSGKLNELPPCLFVVWSIVLAECPLTCTCNMAVNREKGGRHYQFLHKWLKEFGWFQTRGSPFL